MILTTRGRYAVMAMVDIARNNNNSPISLARISSSQNIDIGYLEQIFNRLRKSGLVNSIKGPGGGYVLAYSSTQIFVDSIIKAVDEQIKMTRCKNSKEGCMLKGEKCLTHDLWEGLSNQINQYLASISLADICNKKIELNYK
ncbi:MAG: Rrf2 family transcriptional regulator [Alphaproteobacteria bacterium]